MHPAEPPGDWHGPPREGRASNVRGLGATLRREGTPGDRIEEAWRSRL